MVALSDFNAPQARPQMSDFYAGPQEASPSASESTIRNLAAFSAILSPPEQMEQTYSRVTNELQNSASSETVNSIVQQYDVSDYAGNVSQVREILASEEYSTEEKAIAVQSLATITNGTGLYKRAGISSIIADSEPDDNDETDFTRVEVSGWLDDVDVYNGLVQQQISQINNMYDENFFGSMVDMVKMFIPFYEQANLSELANVIAGEAGENQIGAVAQALTIMGESKIGLREVIQRMPLEQRAELAQTLVDYTINAHGPDSADPNKLLVINQLQSMLSTGGYTGTDRFLDNLASLMDDTILLSPLSKPITRFIGGAVDAVSPAARATAGATRRFEEASARIADETFIADVRTVLEEGQEPMSNAVSSADKLAVRETVAQTVTDRILTQLPDDVAPQVRTDIRNTVDTRMDDYLPGVDIEGQAATILSEVKDALSRRIIAGVDTAPAPGVMDVFRSNASRSAVQGSPAPTSPGRLYNLTNPAKSRATLQSVIQDTTGRLAPITHQTSRTNVIATEMGPEAARVDGSVRPKSSTRDMGLDVDQSVTERVQSVRGDIHFTPNEKEQLRATARQDWRDVNGLVPRTEMSTVGDSATGLRFDMVYGPKNGGFRNAHQAVEQVKFGLRKYGVTEDDIEILKLDGKRGEYRPVNSSDNLNLNGNYLARVKKDWHFNLPSDTRMFDSLTGTKWKLFDSTALTRLTSGRQGGLLQHAVPSTAIINNALTSAASVASDFSAFIARRLLELGREYGELYRALPREQKYLVDNYILEANEKGLKFNPIRLEARGMSPKAIETARAWKKNWDTIYHFENVDLNKSLRARGYEKFVDESGNTDLIVRPISRNQVSGDSVRAWTSDEGGKAVTLNRKEINQLYEDGGTIATSRNPIEIDDDVFEYVVVKNTSDTSYTRALRDDEYTLAYRDGYYTVRYEAPIFIRQRVKDKNGKEFFKAIATAPSRSDAERYLERLRSTDDEVGKYTMTPARTREEQDEFDWQSTVAMGRSTQRVRGQRLKDLQNEGPDLNFKHIEAPEESLINSIQSISARTAHRDFLETAKARWAKQFDRLLPNNVKGKWPENVKSIGQGDLEASLSEIGDAVTMWRYIDAMEQGYSDLINDVTKSFFKTVSDVSGRAGWKWMEDLSNKASQININRFARRKAFRLLLASNPLRQVAVQASQALPVILATNPTFLSKVPSQITLINYMKNGGDVDSYFKAMAETMTGLKLDEAKELMRHYQDSGIEEFVNSHTYMREHMSSVVDRTLAQKAGTMVGRPLDFTQKIGFETGENLLMTSIWLSEYDRLRRAGTTITREVLDNLNAKTRHLTGNMNRAGDMPYNQNTLSGLMQFFGTPHKIFAQVFMGHTGLTRAERAKLGAAYILTYGTGSGYITDQLMRQLPAETDAGVRNIIENGMANLLLNKSLSYLYGQEVSVAFTESFRIGVEQPDVFQFFSDLMDLNLGAIIANSPSGAYVFGDNPKFNNFVHQLMKPFTVPNDEKPEEMLMVGRTFLDMFTGTSNFFKAKYILEHNQAMNTSGKIIDEEVNGMEGLMRLGGFSTMDEVRYYAMQERYYRNSAKPYDDVKELITQVSRRLAMEGVDNNDIEYWMRTMAEAQRVYGNDPFYNNIIMSEIRTRARQGDGTFFDMLMKMANYESEESMEDALRASGAPPETIDTVRTYIDIIRNAE